MAHQVRIQRELSRRSVGYFQSDERFPSDDPWISSNGSMFIEDVQTGVMPIGGRSSARPNFAIELVPDYPEGNALITYAFADRQEYPHLNMRETVSQFIEEVAATLVYKGVVHYEIVKGDLSGDRDSGGDVPKEAVAKGVFRPLVIAGRVIRLGQYYVQLIPRIERSQAGKTFILIPASDVWVLEVPKELGGLRDHKTLLKTLVQTSTLLPGFVDDAMKTQSEIGNFSFTDFRRQVNLAIASATSQWGWPARGLWESDTLEYFRVYRELRFALALAIVRESILSSMNNLLKRIQFPAQLVLKGLPTPGDIKGYMAKMEKSEMTLDEAWKAVRI